MPSEFSLHRVVVDRWEDYSEKSWKVWMGSTFAYWPKSKFDLGDMPNEFYCARKDRWLADKLEEAADRNLIKAA